MGTRATITVAATAFAAELNDSTVARAVAAKLPVEIGMSRWGDEYYALCLFFGPTPASEGNEPRAASDVVPLGRLEGDITALKSMAGSVRARIERS